MIYGEQDEDLCLAELDKLYNKFNKTDQKRIGRIAEIERAFGIREGMSDESSFIAMQVGE
jgi:hypothetical protein